MSAIAWLLGACGGSWQGSIGAVLGKNNEDGRVYVREVPAGMSAARAGLEPDDEILTIDGASAKDMSAPDIHKALQGEVGTKVKLTVRRRTLTREVTVERGPLRGSPDGGSS